MRYEVIKRLFQFQNSAETSRADQDSSLELTR